MELFHLVYSVDLWKINNRHSIDTNKAESPGSRLKISNSRASTCKTAEPVAASRPTPPKPWRSVSRNGRIRFVDIFSVPFRRPHCSPIRIDTLMLFERFEQGHGLTLPI